MESSNSDNFELGKNMFTGFSAKRSLKMRPIDANEVEGKLIDLIAYNPYRIMDTIYLSDALHKVDECQTLDVETVGHARWIPEKIDKRGRTNSFQCSNCGSVVFDRQYGLMAKCDFKYCPYCGARMKEESEDETN